MPRSSLGLLEFCAAFQTALKRQAGEARKPEESPESQRKGLVRQKRALQARSDVCDALQTWMCVARAVNARR
eukprot:14049136-Alexandrium_andersonii.AAC.1